jgi:hypothetical protein
MSSSFGRRASQRSAASVGFDGPSVVTDQLAILPESREAAISLLLLARQVKEWTAKIIDAIDGEQATVRSLHLAV